MSKQTSGIHLYTFGTPNGWKASITLEELGISYNLHKVDLETDAQQAPEYLAINPTGLIPAIVDDNAGGLKVIESGAVQLYLCERYDPEHTLLPKDLAARTQVTSWLFFQATNFAPAGTAVVAPLLFGLPTTKEKIEEAVEKVKWCWDVMEKRLKDECGDWLVGGQYSVADIASLPAVYFTKELLGVKLEQEHPRLAAWLERCLARPAVRKGLSVPDPSPLLDPGTAAEVVKQAGERLAKLKAGAQ